MNIEVSDRQYWKRMNYYDGILYVSMLSIDGVEDWRMIDSIGEKHRLWDMGYDFGECNVTWYYEENREGVEYLNNKKYWVIPVRDII